MAPPKYQLEGIYNTRLFAWGALSTFLQGFYVRNELHHIRLIKSIVDATNPSFLIN